MVNVPELQGCGQADCEAERMGQEVEEAGLSGTAWRPIGEPVAFDIARALPWLDREAGLKAVLDQLAGDGVLGVYVDREGEYVRVAEPVRFEVSRLMDRLWQRHELHISATRLEAAAAKGALTACVLRDVTCGGDVVAEVAGDGAQ